MDATVVEKRTGQTAAVRPVDRPDSPSIGSVFGPLAAERTGLAGS